MFLGKAGLCEVTEGERDRVKERDRDRESESESESEIGGRENFKDNLLNVERETSKKVSYLFRDDLLEIQPTFQVKFYYCTISLEGFFHCWKKTIGLWKTIGMMLMCSKFKSTEEFNVPGIKIVIHRKKSLEIELIKLINLDTEIELID